MALRKPFEAVRVEHGFGPAYDRDSEILILGSFPSVKSREENFYYGHPMNRFWPLLSHIYGYDIGKTIEDKRVFLKEHHIALYDVIQACTIKGSSDASIKNVESSDISAILNVAKIKKIVLNGQKAGRLFAKYQLPKIGESVPYVILPSTSPANASFDFQRLVSFWKKQLLG